MSEEQKKKQEVPQAPPVLGQVSSPLPRITIQFCTQCKWMLRAAYYAQELLSTFNLTLGEVALQPSTGGTFIVAITTPTTTKEEGHGASMTNTLWDRKVDGGFPETKELKRRVRDVIEPGRDLGHVDRDHKKGKDSSSTKEDNSGAADAFGTGTAAAKTVEKCEDCQ